MPSRDRRDLDVRNLLNVADTETPKGSRDALVVLLVLLFGKGGRRAHHKNIALLQIGDLDDTRYHATGFVSDFVAIHPLIAPRLADYIDRFRLSRDPAARLFLPCGTERAFDAIVVRQVMRSAMARAEADWPPPNRSNWVPFVKDLKKTCDYLVTVARKSLGNIDEAETAVQDAYLDVHTHFLEPQYPKAVFGHAVRFRVLKCLQNARKRAADGMKIRSYAMSYSRPTPITFS